MDCFTLLQDAPRHAVIAIGNFDGVHRGHQALLAQVVREARARDAAAGVLTFEPHPRKLFRPDDPPFRITPEAVKARRLAACGLDFACALSFDWDFASQSAEDFIRHVLIGGLNPSLVVVGEDFRFGQLRKGTPAMMRDAGLAVSIIHPVGNGDAVFSSSRIREALRLGDIAAANAALGWDWEIEGVVQHGDRRGRELGFPTANVPLGETLHPAYGIYATLTQIVEDGPDALWHPSATNIGIRPMFEISQGQVETFIFDFNRDIYGKTLRVRPVKRLRGEAKFDSLDALVAQMNEDCSQARLILTTNGHE